MEILSVLAIDLRDVGGRGDGRIGCLHGRIYGDGERKVPSAEGVVLGSRNGEGETPVVAVAFIRVDGGCTGVELELDDINGCKGGIREAVIDRSENGMR
jgi:hypothetical protein